MTDPDSPGRSPSRVFDKLDDAQAERLLPDGAFRLLSVVAPDRIRGRCQSVLKIKPFEYFVDEDEAYSFTGIRADENREGFRGTPKRSAAGGANSPRSKAVVISDRSNIRSLYPLKDIGFGFDEVPELLLDSGLGLRPCYVWRSRSGCYFGFVQQIGEWQGLLEKHPDRFESAKTCEKPPPNSRRFIWSQTRPLEELEPIAERQQVPVGEPEDGCAICHPICEAFA